MSRTLETALPDDALFPRDAAFMARTDAARVQMLGFTPLQLDSVTTMFGGLFGRRPSVRHRSGVSPAARALLERAGIALAEHVLVYEDADEAEALADDLIARGWRLAAPYPLRARRFPSAAQVVPPALWERLNDKARFAELASPDALPERSVCDLDALGALEPAGAVFVKSAGGAATGWGFGVRRCESRAALLRAQRELAALGVARVVVEEAVALEACWCAGLAISDERAACFGGALQLFGAPARQTGSAIDPELPFPAEGAALTQAIGERARALGFRGIAGIDIGRARDGRLLAFDPNFRLNASSAQLLFHGAAAARSGLPASRSFQDGFSGPFAELCDRAARAVDEGWFVPLRALDASLHPLAQGRHLLSGFVLADDALGCGEAAERLRALLA